MIKNKIKKTDKNKMSDDDMDIVNDFLGSPDLEGVV